MPSFRPLPPFTVLAIALALGAISAPALAQRPRGQEPQQQDQQPPPPNRGSHDDDTLSDAVRRIERSNRGEVLSAERMQYDGREVNRLKVMDEDGRVRVYMDDPNAGNGPQPSQRPPAGSSGRPPSNRDND